MAEVWREICYENFRCSFLVSEMGDGFIGCEFGEPVACEDGDVVRFIRMGYDIEELKNEYLLD